MKIDFSLPIKNHRGVELRLSEAEPFTLGAAAADALLYSEPGDPADGSEKLKRFNLAGKVAGGGEVDVAMAELELIKVQVAKAYPTLTSGAIWSLVNELAKEPVS